MREIGMVDRIGTTARDFLARRNFVGRVLAVVTGAVYLSVIASDEGAKQSPSSNVEIASSHNPLLAMTEEVLWLAQNHLPMHPRAIRGDFDFGALQVGTTFESDGACLRFDNDVTVQFADAQVWQPPMIDPGRAAPREVVMARARELKDLTSSLAWKPVKSLRELVGLGEGLTPSGDDFVGGFLFARWHLHQVYPDVVEWNQHAVADLIEYARMRTNVISHAILRDHARGQGVEPMHQLIVALLQGKSLDEIMSYKRALLAIGSTSGGDMLTGAMAGMLSIKSAKLDNPPYLDYTTLERNSRRTR